MSTKNFIIIFVRLHINIRNLLQGKKVEEIFKYQFKSPKKKIKYHQILSFGNLHNAEMRGTDCSTR